MKKNWRNVLLKSHNSIREALEIINNEALRFAMVIDDQERLIGVITDGDIRRGLLNNLSLTDEVHYIMSRTPITATQATSRQKLVEIMSRHGILSLPIVDADNTLVGVEFLNQHSQKTHYKNPVFIMAGGFGTRLQPLTDHCPKPMLKIGKKPILETQILSFIKAGFENFYISTHYMPEKIKEYFGDGSKLGVSITYVHEQEPLGTGGALGLLPKDLPKDLPIIMINGDILTNVDFTRLLNFHVENDGDATMCVTEYDYQIPYGVINGQNGKIKSMVEKPIQRFFINAGIYVVSHRVIQSVPENHRIDMPKLLEQHMSERDQILMFPIHEYWLDIGRLDDFNRAQSDIHSLEFEH